MRGSCGPNITEIFWPRSYGRQRSVFFVLHGCSTGHWSKLFCVLAFLTTTRLLPSSTVLLALLLAYLPLSSIRRPYITFKLPRSNIDTPQRLRNLFRFPATGMCHFLPVHHLEWHFWPGQKVKTQRALHNSLKKFQNPKRTILWSHILVTNLVTLVIPAIHFAWIPRDHTPVLCSTGSYLE